MTLNRTAWGRFALGALLIGMVALLAAPQAHAQGEDPRFDVLVFSKTTGFRHTEAINAGHAAITAMGEAQDFSVTSSEDAGLFTDDGLRDFEVVVFLNTDGNGILNASQRTAFERWMQRGGGLVGIHANANADRDWAWFEDMMGGALFLNHPSGAVQFQPGTINVEDTTHPATESVPNPWTRSDEWYSFTANPRDDVHVLMTLDEDSYDLTGATPMGEDHPIAWCSLYDGGRHFYTALGHHGSYWSEPDYLDHISGAIEWAAGEEDGDCGEEREGIPTDASFDKVTLDDNTENPMEIAIAPNGDVYYVELAGRVKHYDASENEINVIGQIPVHRGNENGLLGITLDPNFATNDRLYLFYSAPTPEEQHVSRFTLAGDGTIDMASEELLLTIPHQRIVCCHSAGSMTFGPGGNLFISTGDDTEHSQSQGYNPIDDDVLRNNPGSNPDADRAYDARRTSGNTNDLRGKIIRIRPLEETGGSPGPGNTYEIPAGNLFGLGGVYPGVEGQTRPEIYTMGHRNPFRIAVDQETGWVYNGEVGPDANGENANRGPRGYDELNQIRQAGNMGWPYCIADNKPYRDWTFPSGPAGITFDCSGQPGGGPVNTSNYNTGLTQTPPTTGALLWWPYTPYPAGFPWGSEPTAIPTGPGRTAIAGPTYHFDPENPNDTKLPAYYDDKVFFADWSRDWIATVELDENGQPAAIEEFMPGADFRHPQDLEMGANGSFYVLEWGRDFNYAGSGINPDSGLYRIDYAKGTRTPIARASSDVDSGPTPLEVTFSSEGSEDPDGDELTYEWDFNDGSPVSNEANPTHTFTTAGTYTVRLTATDSTGKSGTSTVIVNVGNTRPEVELTIPVQGGVFNWGDEIAYEVTVTDAEDAEIDCSRVSVNPGIFHDEGGNAHVHPGVSQTGCSGTFEAPAESGHAKSANIALVLTATYTDSGGQSGSSPLEGASTRQLTPAVIQAEHYIGATGTQNNTVVEAEGGATVGYADQGEWIYFEPVNLLNIDQLRIRYAAGQAGGVVDVRVGAADGPVVGTATLMPTASWTSFQNVVIPLEPSAESGRLYFTFRGRDGQQTTDLFDLDEFEFIGAGVASDSAPFANAEADVISGAAPLAVNFTGTGSDPDGDELSYEWDFDSDGTVDATTANGSYVYDTPGQYTATFTVTAGGRSRSAEVEIDVYGAVQSCPADDEFSGDALDSKWEVIRRDDSRLSVANGSLNIISAKQDIHGGDSGLPNIVLQDLPDGVPFTATTRVSWNPTENYQNAGLLIYESDSQWIKTGMVWSGSRVFEAFKELNNSPSALGNGPAVPTDWPSTFYVRFLSVDGNTVQAQRSRDGETWINTGSATNLNGLNDPRIGVYATASTTASTGTPTASFDFFQLTVPTEPSDEFDGDELNLCRWSEIVRPDPSGYSVGDGALTLPAAHGDFFANGSNDNPNIILQPALAGEWTATTRMSFVPDENYEQAGIVVYGDDGNYAKLDLVHAGGRAIEFLREVNNTADGFDGTVQLPADFPDTLELRVTSDGEFLNAYWRPVGGQWATVGQVDMTPIAAIPNPKIGIYANDSNATVTTRDDAVFDFFRLVPGLPGGDAPVTTVTLDPAAPDGEAGWYTGPVEVTLTTADGATTQYRVNDGEFQDYSGPFTLDVDGAHVVTYRSTDGEGNVEEDQTLDVQIDATVPTASAIVEDGVITIEGADDGSGLDMLEYRLDGGNWTSYATPVTVTAPGSHTVEYRATDVAGNVGEVGSETFSVEGDDGAPQIQAFADPMSGPAPLQVRLSATGLDPDGGALTYRWQLDNGSAFGSNVTHTFQTPGVHTATVTATDDEGMTTSVDVEITVTEPVNEAPTVEASADVTSGPAPLRVRFNATGDDPDGRNADLIYAWDFGDGGTSFARNPVHVYAEPGEYTATVTVTDAGDESGTAEVQITVTDPPGNRAPSVEAAALPASGTAPLDVRFTSQGTDPDGDALTYAWDFGDGVTGTGRNGTHTYAAGGTYTATVTVTDPGGLTASADVEVVVGNPPANQAPTVMAAGDPRTGTAPLRVRFTSAARDPEGEQFMTVWDFGDGAKAGGPSAIHVYTQPGTYTATVTVTDRHGASSSATVQIVVAARQAAAPPRTVAPQGDDLAVDVATSLAGVKAPKSVRTFRKRGLKVSLACAATGDAKAKLKLTRKHARRLGLGKRKLAVRTVECVEGETTTFRLKPRKAARRAMKGQSAVKVMLRVQAEQGTRLTRKLRIR